MSWADLKYLSEFRREICSIFNWKLPVSYGGECQWQFWHGSNSSLESCSTLRWVASNRGKMTFGKFVYVLLSRTLINLISGNGGSDWIFPRTKEKDTPPRRRSGDITDRDWDKPLITFWLTFWLAMTGLNIQAREKSIFQADSFVKMHNAKTLS